MPGPGDLKSRKLSRNPNHSWYLACQWCTSTLIESWLWCLPLWSGSHAIPLNRQQFLAIEAHSVPILYPLQRRNITGPNWTTSHNIWQEVPPLTWMDGTSQFFDHTPLQHLFSETCEVPAIAIARIRRSSLMLSAYNYPIPYKPEGDNTNADRCSQHT